MNSHISRLLRRRPSESARTARRSAKSRRRSLRTEPLESRAMLAAGDLDTTFDADGIATIDFSSLGSVSQSLQTIAVQSDGKIVAAGQIKTTSGDLDFALARLNSDGSLDATFGVGGKVVTDMAGASDGISGLLIQPNGKIVVAGTAVRTTRGKTSSDVALARYNTNGTLDTSFGAGGKVFTGLKKDAEDSAADIAIQSDGKLVVAGRTGDPGAQNSSGKFLVIRYNTNGTLDTTFDQDGIVVKDVITPEEAFGSPEDYALDLLVQADGRIVAAGTARGGGGGGVIAIQRMALVRLNANGSLDTSFGADGQVLTEVGMDAEARAIVQQADGMLVVGGEGGPWNTGSPVVLRHNSNGTLDGAFGTSGIFQISSATDNAFNGLALAADGKIVAAGGISLASGNNTNHTLVARLDSTGALDPTFDNDGYVVTPVSSTTGDTAADLVIQADGKIVAVGNVFINRNRKDGVFLRYQGDSPLLATATGPGAPASALLTDALLAPIVAEARARWATLGVDPARLTGLRITTADLNGPYLGLASGNSITLDRDAARWGWFIDSTPADDAEFLLDGNQGEQNRVDLLTAVMHEMGHVLGLGHDSDSGDLMYESLAAGTRHTPDAGDALAAALAYSFDQYATKERKSR